MRFVSEFAAQKQRVDRRGLFNQLGVESNQLHPAWFIVPLLVNAVNHRHDNMLTSLRDAVPTVRYDCHHQPQYTVPAVLMNAATTRSKSKRGEESETHMSGSSHPTEHEMCESRNVSVSPVATLAPATRARIRPDRYPCRTIFTVTGSLLMNS